MCGVQDASAAGAAALDQVGPRLKRLRTQRGITLTGLADTTGISKSTLSRLECQALGFLEPELSRLAGAAWLAAALAALSDQVEPSTLPDPARVGTVAI